MKISLINRFYPPDGAPTGQGLKAISDELCRRLEKPTITVYASNAKYSEGKTTSRDVVTSSARVQRISSFYTGKKQIPRLFASMLEGRRLADLATRDADLVISLTDPPLLCYWIGRFANQRDVKWIEYTMDLFPDAFVAAGLSSPRNIVFRHIETRLQRLRPDLHITLGERQYEYLKQKGRAALDHLVLPYGIIDHSIAQPPPWHDKDIPTLIYAGNIGEAHSANALATIVKEASARNIRIVLALSGSKAEELKMRIEGIENVWQETRLSYGDFSYATANIVSLQPDWTHICVPSKAVTSICMGSPILFIGSKESDTYQMFRDAAWFIPTDMNTYGVDHAALIEFLNTIISDHDQCKQKRESVVAASERLRSDQLTTYGQLATWIQENVQA